MGYVIAKYLRLSIEDKKTKSMSIGSQRMLLDKFIDELQLPDVEVLEFVDNGYTGTNYERPAIQELLELVRVGKINCIVVKDFSRLGRNIIDTGYYVEQVFPLYRVRFVSLGDGYDSDDNKNGIGGFDVSFRFLINELYSRDLSQKIKTAKARKQELGEAVSKNCVYGYTLDKARKMVPDAVAAAIVRDIYHMTLQGVAISEIMKQFQEEKRLIPSAHKNHKKPARDGKKEYEWSRSTIIQILRDKQYTGTYIARKSTSIEVGSKHYLKNDESKWIMMPEHHEAIVSQQDFDAVQEILKLRSRPYRKSNTGRKSTSGRFDYAEQQPH